MLKDPTNLFDGEISDKTKKYASTISFLAQAPFLSAIMFIILDFVFISDLTKYFIVTLTAIVTSTVLPLLVIIYYSKKFNNNDMDIVRREDRFIPLLVSLLCYLIGVISLWLVGAPKAVTVLMLCYLVSTFVMTIISLKWKISLHASGTVGPVVALSMFLWPYGLISAIIIPPVLISRYYLKKHTPAQLIAGSIEGFLIVFLLCWFLI